MDVSKKYSGVSGNAGRWTTEDANAVVDEIEGLIEGFGLSLDASDNKQLKSAIESFRASVSNLANSVSGLLDGSVQAADSSKLAGQTLTQVKDAAESQTAASYNLSKLKAEIEDVITANGASLDNSSHTQLRDLFDTLNNRIDNIDLSNVDAALLNGESADTIKTEAANSAINILESDSSHKVKAALVADNAADADKLGGKTLAQIKDEIESGVETITNADFYVNFTDGDDANDGSDTDPFKTFAPILTQINNYDNVNIIVIKLSGAKASTMQLEITNNVNITFDNIGPVDMDIGTIPIVVKESGKLSINYGNNTMSRNGTYPETGLIKLSDESTLTISGVVTESDNDNALFTIDAMGEPTVKISSLTVDNSKVFKLDGIMKLIASLGFKDDNGNPIKYDDLPDYIDGLRTTGSSGVYYNLITNINNTST